MKFVSKVYLCLMSLFLVGSTVITFRQLFRMTTTTTTTAENQLTEFLPLPTLPTLPDRNRSHVTASASKKTVSKEKVVSLDETIEFSIPLHQQKRIATTAASGPQTLWSSSKKIPDWMKNYFDWHQDQRIRGLSPTSNKYIVVQCLASYRACGGLTDRLKTLPVYLLFAHMTNRVLLIRWNTPCPLEEFFVPPSGGLDWRVPKSILPLLNDLEIEALISNIQQLNDTLTQSLFKDVPIWTTKIQHHDGGRDYFNNMHGHQISDPKHDLFGDLFRDVFHLMLEPTPRILSKIKVTMARLSLVPGNYSAAHVRIRYPSNHGPIGMMSKGNHRKTIKDFTHQDKNGGFDYESHKQQANEIATNAANCAANLLPGAPIYFASDSHQLVTYMLEKSPFAKSPISVVGNASSVEPLHFDTPLKNRNGKTCSDFDSAIEEIWILGQSQCVSYGMGGYGRLAQALSFNKTCSVQHRNHKGFIQHCANAF